MHRKTVMKHRSREPLLGAKHCPQASYAFLITGMDECDLHMCKGRLRKKHSVHSFFNFRKVRVLWHCSIGPKQDGVFVPWAGKGLSDMDYGHSN